MSLTKSHKAKPLMKHHHPDETTATASVASDRLTAVVSQLLMIQEERKQVSCMPSYRADDVNSVEGVRQPARETRRAG